LGEHVAQEVDPTALHGGTGHGGLDGLAQAQVSIGDDQLHPGQPAGLQAAEELGPEGTVLAVADVQAQPLPAAVAAHPGGDHHGLGDHPAVDAGLAVGRVHEHIRKDLAGEGTVPEGANLAVQVGAAA
jgi:hypothetical protein